MRVVIVDRSTGNGYTLGLATGIMTCGIDVCVWGPHGGDTDETTADVKAVMPRAGMRGHRLRKILDAAVGCVRATYHLVKVGVDVIHIQWPTRLDLVYAVMARRACGAKVVFTAHNPQKRWGERSSRWQEALIGMADAVITHGPTLRDGIVNTARIPEARVHALEVGNYEHVIRRYERSDARRRLGLPDDTPIFAFIGQIRARKGLDVLCDSFTQYIAAGGTGMLLIAGAETERGYIESLRPRARSIEDRIRWITAARPLARGQLDLVVSAANAVVLPFHDASQSASVIYAMTHGRYIITTDVGEVGRLLLDHGKVLRPRDREALAVALREAELSGAHCDAIGTSAREHALADLSWNVIGAQTADIYRAIAKRP